MSNHILTCDLKPQQLLFNYSNSLSFSYFVSFSSFIWFFSLCNSNFCNVDDTYVKVTGTTDSYTINIHIYKSNPYYFPPVHYQMAQTSHWLNIWNIIITHPQEYILLDRDNCYACFCFYCYPLDIYITCITSDFCLYHGWFQPQMRKIN